MSRIKAYFAAVADAKGGWAAADKSHKDSDIEAAGAAMNASAQAYRNLTRAECAKLWPGSPESKDMTRRAK